eukprot:scaffold906_cov395-Prasinococcus_capsulatus_cf.AAC.1
MVAARAKLSGDHTNERGLRRRRAAAAIICSRPPSHVVRLAEGAHLPRRAACRRALAEPPRRARALARRARRGMQGRRTPTAVLTTMAERAAAGAA